MNIITNVHKGLTLIKRSDGYHSVITIPMYAPFKDYLHTSKKTEALDKAEALYLGYLKQYN